MKAKRSTYNYSLPITVKKACKCLGSLCGLERCASTSAEDGASGLQGWGVLPAIPREGAG